MEKVSYGGWDNCYRLSNDVVELIVTGDVGPRIIRFGFIGQENMFKEFPEQLGITESEKWLSFGGHRLWHAPESITRTYYPDLDPVLIQEIENGLLVTQQPEPTTGIQKQIEIKISTDEPEIKLTHTLINHNLWPIETAAWAISVMAPGGTAILPLPPRGPHPDFILPTSILSLWPYTDLSDPRWKFGKRYLMLKQDPQIKYAQKIGIFATDGWAAYANKGCLFVKQVPIQFDGIYPDFGANFEVYTDGDILEVESLGPYESIPPKGKIDHQEHWSLFKNVPAPQDEADILDHIVPLVD